jgi:hypothetical protein
MAVNKSGNYTKPTLRKNYLIKLNPQLHMVLKLDNGVQEKHSC